MVRKALLILAVIVVGLPASYLTFEHFRGRRRLAQTLDRLIAQGERLDITALAPPPPAPASNGLARLLRVSPRLQEAGSLHPPAMRCIAAGRAAPSSQIKSWEQTSQKFQGWASVEEWSARNETELAELHAALALPECRSSLNYSEGFKMLFPHLAPIKSACIALSTSAALAARDGDLDRALTDLADIGRASAAMGREPVVLSQLVRVALVAIALNRGWDILHARDWTDDQLVRLDAALPSDDLIRDMVTALEGERAIGLIAMRQIKGREITDMLDGLSAGLGGNPTPSFTMPDSLDAAAELASEMTASFAQSIRKYAVMPLWHFAFNDHAIAVYLDAMQDFITASRQSLKSGRMPIQADAGGSNELLLGSQGRVDWSKNLYSQTAIPALDRVLAKAFSADIQRTLLRTDIALQRHRLRHGRYPDSLGSLVPDFLPAVPIDGADGQPLRYRLAPGATQPVLWSAGENGIDDGGDPAPDGYKLTARFLWWRGKDAVWPQTASPEEIADWIQKEQQPRQPGTATSASTQATTTFRMSPELMKRYGLLPSTPSAPPPPPTNAEPPTAQPEAGK